MRGSCSPVEPVDDAAAAEARVHLDEVVRIGDHLADDRGVASERMRAHRREQPVGVLGAADRDELAFVGDVERVEAQELAGGSDLRPHRNVGSRAITMPQPDCRASSFSVVASPPRVGSRRQ